ncbi:MAG TPA: hypothetical protein VJK05_02605, partial [archaeon]|nr:hypothetical protein [archaeon]
TNSSIAEEFEFSTPGKYNIFISHVPTQSNWPWIGLPNTTTKIWIRHKLESTEGADNSLFYLPFDGELGLAGDNNRVGYGVSLKADSNQLKVNLPSAVAVAGERPLKLTAKDGGDNGNLITFKKNDLSGMVSDGLLFSFNNAEKKLTLSPSMPAPLGLVVAKNLSEENEVVINAIYSFFTSGNQAFNPSEGGEVFAVNWSIMGFGVALEAGEKEDLKVDFFGNSISDTRMKDEKEGESANTFKVEWSGSADAARNGTLMLAGVLYHPISKSPFISVSRDSTALAVIRNRDGQRSATDAVQSINLTDIVLPSGVQKENLDVLESLKKLNEEGFLCSTSNQNSLELRWHEDKIIKESGIIDRLNEERTRLQAR